MCKEELPFTLEFFYVKPTGQTHPYCKVCRQAYSFKRYYANQEKSKVKSREGNKKIPEYKKFLYKLKSAYGLEEERYTYMLNEQRGCCVICNKSLINPQFNKMDMVVDHNHTTGEVRGLLCTSCNTMLGMSQDSVSILASGITYLTDRGSA